MGTMKAIRKLERKKGANLVNLEIPKIKSDEVLIKVIATSICGTDVHIYKWDKWSETRIKNIPQTLGHEVCGEVIEVGSSVRKIKVGDFISAETHIPCKKCINCLTGNEHICTNGDILGVDRDGVFAEYAVIPESVAWVNDKSIPPEIASVQEPLGNATYAVLGEDYNIYGKRVAIFGDGPTALFAIGVAKFAGASKIFHVGVFDFNMEIGKKMGADFSLKATDNIDRIQFIRDNTDGYGADIVVEMAGAKQAVEEGLNSLRKGGRFSAFGITPEQKLEIDYNNQIVFKGIQIHGISGRRMFDTWLRVKNMLSSKKLNIKPVITNLFSLEDFEKGFEEMMKIPRVSAKIVLFPDKKILNERLKEFKE